MKTTLTRRVTVALAALATLGAVSPAALAQAYPNKPVKLVVPYAPGGAMDAAARIVATELTKTLGQTVLVDNRAGGAGTLGTHYVAKAEADGYTLCFCVTGVMTITPLSDPKVPYDPLKDLMPVSHVHNMENVIMARKDLPANTFKELIALAKSRTQGLTFGTPGAGGTHHLGGEWLQRETGVKLVHVPYKGEGPAVGDLLGGQIDMVFGTAAVAAPLVKAGKVKVLANLGKNRSKLLPDVPTVAESGYPNYSWVNFVGINVPAGTPAPVVKTLADSVIKTMHDPALIERFHSMGFEPVGSSTKDYARLLQRETATWGELLKTTTLTRD
ncbi:tripartite tricarboxylate transporter substrate binding protein [Aquabacterium sp. A7-Y]|uniref:Bug family tripartite tricarboxylate transporter substrate binding protein n=1 Tax=Aquabacterium sp. A7-Y TaxID=1349605 RepID=UPI00223D46DC|nr:tripartite tricarboxylate transporter substrate binding protein [Aquabacterium sp. A7-Y]MCW7538820.1 tripartite tricarboxylate transporter substrate binding protein [Aquabacterium sp. A7-Y]